MSPRVIGDGERQRVEKQLQALGINPTGHTEEQLKQLMARVAMDIQVLDLARSTGLTSERHVLLRHWALFDAELQAQEFAKWLGKRGYAHEYKLASPAGEGVQVQFAHRSRLTQYSICKRTVAFHQKAASLGGDYDGWEARADGLLIGGSWRPVAERLGS